MNTAFLPIDIQNDYFPGGRYPLHNPEMPPPGISVIPSL